MIEVLAMLALILSIANGSIALADRATGPDVTVFEAGHAEPAAPAPSPTSDR